MTMAVRRNHTLDGAGNDERPLTPQEAADFLRTSVRSLYRLPIPCHQVGPRRRLYSKRILAEFLEDCLLDPDKKHAAP
jgi:hypothetical protein